MNMTHRKSIRIPALLLVLILLIALLPTNAFAAQAVTAVTVTDLDRPVVGAHPDFTATVSGNGVKEYEILWWDYGADDPMEENDVFEQNHVYYAEVDVTAQSGYNFGFDDSGYYLGTVTMRDYDNDFPAGVDADDGVLYFFTIDYAVTPFVDVSAESYYAYPVLLAAVIGITSGTDATHFSPNLPCTRAQAVTFLWRAAGEPEPTSSVNPFVDVKESDYYYKAVLWAAECGITTGTDATHFSPSKPCTRAQIVTFLWRFCDCPTSSIIIQMFNDVPATSYSYPAVQWAAEVGITQGTSDYAFSPDKPCTRAQIVTFLYRAS